jgi:bifunctional non-homologous end joining protein LigD
VGGRQLRIRNLDRVVFPRTGTTKGELLDHYSRVADTMLPHLRWLVEPLAERRTG